MDIWLKLDDEDAYITDLLEKGRENNVKSVLGGEMLIERELSQDCGFGFSGVESSGSATTALS